VTGNVNLRTGPGTDYKKITTIPGGARVRVLGCGSWCQVNFQGIRGFVSASYVAGGNGFVKRPPPMARAPMMMHRPPPPTAGFYKTPYWDQKRNAWYDGKRWYLNGRWYDKPSGLSLGFGFSGH
jgi:uncharacterized protein YraI